MNRRGLLMAGATIPFATGATAADKTATSSATFVLVHGAWHGGWCWSRTRRILEASGARVSTPTLTGVGERSHLISREVDLDTHVEDIVNHLDREDLTDVVLVGHSYGGFPATLAATRASGRLRQLVLLDAFFPHEGDTILIHAGTEIANDYNAKAAADIDWNIPPLPAEVFGLKGDDAAWVDKHLTAHPIATYTQPARYGTGSLPKRTYVQCTESTVGGVLATSLAHVRADKDFGVIDIAAGHDVMVDRPQLLADTLIGIAG